MKTSLPLLARCVFVVVLLGLSGARVGWAQGVAEATPESAAVDAAEKPQPGFLDALQQQYLRAYEAGETTARSSGQWLSEQYDSAVSSATEAGNSATNWVSSLYDHAVRTGETTARSATDWVSEDVGKIGTWEYRVLEMPGNPKAIEQRLNEMGRQRWECFAVQPDRLFLKRPHRSYLQQLPARELLRLAPLFQGGTDGAAAE